MEQNYDNGAEFWRDTAATHSLDAAATICGDYLNTRLGQELSREETQFCGELFATMVEATAGRADPAKIVYPYPVQEANERGERTVYFENRDRNGDCARAIDAAIKGSYYKLYHYNVDIAAMTVIHQYGFPRVNAVLAYCFQKHEWDGRYSDANKQWARGFDLPEQAFTQAWLNEHPVLIESFANHVRRLYGELGAERFDLPGQPESGEAVEGYGITRTITFDDQRGFAIAAHPTAGYVCWMFRTDRGARDYFWGHYCNGEKDAANNYLARIAVYMSDGTREAPPRANTSVTHPPQHKPRDRREER